MSLLKPRGARKSADPSITNSQVQDVFAQVMQGAGTRDILGHFALLSDISWKQAPKVQLIVRYQEALSLVADVDPGMLLKHSTIAKALADEHAAKACLFPTSALPTTQMVINRVSNDFRALLAQVRVIMGDDKIMRLAFSKASSNEVRVLGELFEKIASAKDDVDLQGRVQAVLALCMEPPGKKPKVDESALVPLEDGHFPVVPKADDSAVERPGPMQPKLMPSGCEASIVILVFFHNYLW